MAAPADARDPRFKPFRVAMYAVFFAVAGAFALLVTVSVIRSVWAMSPSPSPPQEPTLTVRECLDSAGTLWTDLERHRQALSDATPVRGSEPAWYVFRMDWLGRYRGVEARCALESHERGALKDVFGRLLDLMDGYTTSAVQYTGQLGPAVDAFRGALSKARQEPAAGRF